MTEPHSGRGLRPLRLLVETDDPSMSISDFGAFSQAGFEVVLCHGPDCDHPCPAFRGEPCPAVENADVVYNAFGNEMLQACAVDAVHTTSARVPLVVKVADGSTGEIPDDCMVLSRFVSIPGQVAALRRAALGAAASLSR